MSMESNAEVACCDRELICDSQSTLIYRSVCGPFGHNAGDANIRDVVDRQPVAIKKLRLSCPDREQLQAFYKEYDILSSERLASCTAVRKALHKDVGEDGSHEIYLEWIDGGTLKHWVKLTYEQFNMRSDDDPVTTKDHFRTLATLAHAIVKSISEIHKAGVVINNISAENIILARSTDPRRDWDSVKIIDLASAHFLEGSRGDICAEAYQADLRGLGAVLYELFSGQSLFQTRDCSEHENVNSEECMASENMLVEVEANESRMKKRGKPSLFLDNYTPLRELGVPVALCALVSNMIAAAETSSSSTQEFYSSTDEIEEDLGFMLLDPKRFLWNIYEEDIDGSVSSEIVQVGKLDVVKGKLYGREEDTSMLMDICNRFIAGTSDASTKDMVMLSGYAGIGKSSLVQNVCEPFMKARGAFIGGKFHRFRQANPLSVIADVFNQYCNMILDQQHEYTDQIMGAIRDAIGSNGKMLIDLMPNLSKIIGQDQRTHVRVSGAESLNQLKFLFHEFVRAIANPSFPILFFLDDLQWVDATSLDLIRLIVTDIQISSFLFIGSYRDNEVGKNHPLFRAMHKFEEAGVSITEIKVNTIGIKSINTFISDTLHLTPRLTQPLSNLVYRKTGGNPLFIVQFLKTINDEGKLRFSLDSWRWEWDIEGINFLNIPDNVIELMKNKMLQLSRDVQWALKVVACLGRQCDESFAMLLNGVDGNHVSDIEHSLNVAVCEGLLDKAGTSYIFAHDQIQHAAYSLIPESERESIHLQIGRHVLAQAKSLEPEATLFLVVDQLNGGSSLIEDYQERIELARLNLKAGEKAMSLSFFAVAAAYLEAGVSLLDDEKDWERNYDLMLKLISYLAEADNVIGNSSRVKLCLGKLFVNAKSFEDKLGAYYTLISSLAVEHKLMEAVQTGLNVLEQLGEPFPDPSDKSVRFKELMKTRKLLGTMSDDTLLKLDVMKDKQKLAAMYFLDLITMYGSMVKPEMMPLLVCRAMQLSLEHGISKESAHVFSSYGFMLCGPMGDVREGYRFGKLALALLERFNERDCVARVETLVYGVIQPWIEPVHLSLDPVLRSQKAGMLIGDPAFAQVSISIYLTTSLLHCGRPLAALAQEMKLYCLQMASYNQDSGSSLIQPLWQTTLNLVGQSENPVELTGAVMNQEEELRKYLQKKQLRAAYVIYLCSMWLSYLFQDYDLAAKMAEKSHDIDKFLPGKIEIRKQTFFHGLIALALTRTSKLKKWKMVADKAIERMEKWASISPWNCQHMLELMNAERSFSSGDYDRAGICYEEAIITAGKHGFIHDQALASERAAIFYLETGDKSLTDDYFRQSEGHYRQWGAHTKADQVQLQYSS